MITDLEPDILECEVKWALESITVNKASGLESEQRFSLEIFPGFHFNRDDFPVLTNKEIHFRNWLAVIIIFHMEDYPVSIGSEALSNDVFYEHSFIDVKSICQNSPIEFIVHEIPVTETEINE